MEPYRWVSGPPASVGRLERHSETCLIEHSEDNAPPSVWNATWTTIQLHLSRPLVRWRLLNVPDTGMFTSPTSSRTDVDPSATTLNASATSACDDAAAWPETKGRFGQDLLSIEFSFHLARPFGFSVTSLAAIEPVRRRCTGRITLIAQAKPDFGSFIVSDRPSGLFQGEVSIRVCLPPAYLRELAQLFGTPRAVALTAEMQVLGFCEDRTALANPFRERPDAILEAGVPNLTRLVALDIKVGGDALAAGFGWLDGQLTSVQSAEIRARSIHFRAFCERVASQLLDAATPSVEIERCANDLAQRSRLARQAEIVMQQALSNQFSSRDFPQDEQMVKAVLQCVFSFWRCNFPTTTIIEQSCSTSFISQIELTRPPKSCTEFGTASGAQGRDAEPIGAQRLEPPSASGLDAVVWDYLAQAWWRSPYLERCFAEALIAEKLRDAQAEKEPSSAPSQITESERVRRSSHEKLARLHEWIACDRIAPKRLLRVVERFADSGVYNDPLLYRLLVRASSLDDEVWAKIAFD